MKKLVITRLDYNTNSYYVFLYFRIVIAYKLQLSLVNLLFVVLYIIIWELIKIYIYKV
jgi:hypothetical protein